MTDPVRSYRESAVRGATPVGLIVILYEEIVRSVRRAQRALRNGNIEERTNALTHAINVVGHLRGVLNFEIGGPIARNLASFYDTMQAQILAANISASYDALESIAQAFFTVKEAWQTVDREIGGQHAESDLAHLAAAVKFSSTAEASGALPQTAARE